MDVFALRRESQRLEKRTEDLLPEAEEVIDKDRYKDYLSSLGIGSTSLVQLNEGIQGKPEYRNWTESVKARAGITIHWLMEEFNELDSKRAVTASSGNFGKTLSKFLDRQDRDLTIYMSEGTVEENTSQTAKIEEGAARISKCPGGYCPTADADRASAIERARAEEELNPETIKNYDQYALAGNPLAHYLTTGEEIVQQEPDLTHFVTSLGTCGSFLGIGYRLKEWDEDIKLIGLIPEKDQHQEKDHYQPGIRSENELGATEFWEEAQEVAEEIIRVSDQDAYQGMLKLWERGVPAGITAGTNYSGASEVYEQGDKIVTLIPDAQESYEDFLREHLPQILDKDFEEVEEKWESLNRKASREREEHIRTLSEEGR